MKYSVLAAAFCATRIAAQTSVSNPEVYISGCDALRCTDSNSTLCREGVARGVGIAPRIVRLPGSDTNLTLSLVDDDPEGVVSAPYRYLFNTQKLYVGAPSGVDLRDQQPACALMFQYQAQPFPFLTGNADPNTTQCGDAISANDMARLANFVSDFNFGGNDSDGSENVTTSGIPRCDALADYLKYRIRQFDIAFAGYYYENLVSITGGTLAGPSLNSTSDATSYGSCQPTLPDNYELFNVLSAQQVLQPNSGYDPGLGGRNGTTPIMTVMYGSDGTPTDVQFFCMQQLAPGNKELPAQTLRHETGAGVRAAMHSGLAVAVGIAMSLISTSLV